jgi:hypothetical protein
MKKNINIYVKNNLKNMEHIKTFEDYCYELNENIFTDAYNAAKEKLKGIADKAISKATSYALDIINKNPQLQQQVEALKAKFTPNDIKLAQQFIANPATIKSKIDEQGGETALKEALLLESMGEKAKGIVTKILTTLGLSAGVAGGIGVAVAGGIAIGTGSLFGIVPICIGFMIAIFCLSTISTTLKAPAAVAPAAPAAPAAAAAAPTQ